ncbi:hypothetical protein [Streptomyces sp. NPDC018045]
MRWSGDGWKLLAVVGDLAAAQALMRSRRDEGQDSELEPW